MSLGAAVQKYVSLWTVLLEEKWCHTKDTVKLEFKSVKINQGTSNAAFLTLRKYCSGRRIGYWSSDIVLVFMIIFLMHLGTAEDLTLAVERLSYVSGILLQKPCKSFMWQRSRIGPDSCWSKNLWKWWYHMIAETLAEVCVLWNPKLN